MTLALYREAFEHHVDRCAVCSLVTRQLCKVGRDLFKAYEQRCASLASPIPVLSKAGAKA